MSKLNSTLTADRVRELFDFAPETGLLTMRIRRRKCPIGSVAGRISINKGGRPQWFVTIDDRLYLGHRIIWLHVHGLWPRHQIDHINGDSSDNRLCNLRDVPAIENSRNLKRSALNTSGITGVAWRPEKDAWRAYITVRRKSIHLGYFETVIDAVASRKRAERELGFHKNHGRSGPLIT